MTGINSKNIKIRDQVFKGDLGAESKLQNDAILAILLRQDAIVASMTPTQRGKYDTAIEPYQDFTSQVREHTLTKYNEVRAVLGKEPFGQGQVQEAPED